MLEDEYLMAFVNDVRSIGSLISTFIQFIFGISYLSGKYLVESLVSVAEFIYTGGISFMHFIASLSEALLQISSVVFHGALLVYYGLGKIVEAFYITFVDIMSLFGNMYTSFCQFIEFLVSLLGSSFTVLAVIPSQLNTALSLVGDMFMAVMAQVLYGLRHFVASLIWTPIYAVQVISTWILFLFIHLPIAIIKLSTNTFTISAVIGLAVILLVGYIYSQLTIAQIIGKVRRLGVFSLHRGSGFLFRMFKKLKTTTKSSSHAENGLDDSDDENDSKSRGLCVVCHDNVVSFISSPCNHVCLCRDCVHRLVEYDNRCPICRNTVEYFSRIYLS